MNHYTYLLQSQANDMMYIGVRSCQGMPEGDNYWGSSKHLPRGVGKSLRGICDKFILGRFESRKDAVADEIRRHNLNDVAKNPNFWNKAKQTATGFDTSGTTHPSWNKGLKWTDEQRANKVGIGKGRIVAQETRDKISKAQKGKPKWSDEQKKVIGDMARGRKHTEEAKAKISKNNSRWNKGISPSDEVRKKMSDVKKR
jgi:hypothetical protein